MKKFGKHGAIALFSLCICMICCFAVNAAELTDINGHWAKEYIEYGVEKGYISGYEDGTFLPDKTVTRAEFSKMINSAVKLTAVGTAKADFKDVKSDDWFFNEVKKAENAGYIAGYEDSTFRPNNSVTRQEAAVILSRIVLPVTDRADINSFGDGDKVDTWATDAVTMIAAKGYIKGDENKNFNPKGALTRSQAAKLICEFVKNENIVNKNQNITEGGKEIIYSESLFTDDIVIDIEGAEELTVTFKDCRVLGNVYIKNELADVELENTKIKNLFLDADDIFVKADKTSEVKNAYVNYPATLSGNGFMNAVLSGDELSSGLVKLNGTFDKVEVSGDAIVTADVVKSLVVTDKVSLTIQSGTIEKLEAASSAKGATITLSKKTVVENANNKAAISYTGSGTIEVANNEVTGVEYDGVTVDKTTGKVAQGAGTGTTDDNFFKDVSVSPEKGKTNQAISVNVSFTFLEEVFDEDGKKLDAEYIEDNFELRKSSATGSKVSFDATIASSNKKITLNPTSNLSNGTTYYVVIPKGTLTYEDGSENDEYVTYFKTASASSDSSSSSSDDDDDIEITFTPGGGDDASVDTEIVVTFSDKVYKSSSKGTLTAAYCEDYVFEIRKGSTSGDEVDFTATVASTYKKVTLIPDEMLEPDTKYYVIANKKLYDGDGDLIAKDYSYFNTEGGLAVSISPENGATNVSTTPEIVLEFSETVLNYNGKALTGADVEDGVVEIRKSSKTGDAIGFTAEVVTGAKKIIITPEELEVGKKYYVILLEEALVGKESKEENEEVVTYFTVAAATAPMITPADGKKNVGVDTQIEIKFADKLYAYKKTDSIAAKEELTSANIAEYLEEYDVVKLRRKTSSGTVVPCDVDLSADGTTIILTPSSELAVNYDYYVVVKGSTLYVGTKSTNKSATTMFSTNEALMPTFYPEDGDKNIEVDEVLKITFSESIFNSEGDELTKNDVVNDVVRLYKKSNGEDVDFGAKVSGKVISITPSEDLEGGTEYVLAVNSGSVTNNSGVSNQAYSVTFKTESKVVKTVTCDPKNAATKVSVYVNPVVTFASPIYKSTGGDVTSKYAGNYILLRELKSTGTEVACTIEVSDDFKEFTIIPDEPLEKNKKYYITITSGKFAYEDDSTVSAKSFYFTTTSEAEEEPLECLFCFEPHTEDEHVCSKCGDTGHENARWCETCENHTHETSDEHCEECGLYIEDCEGHET